MIKSALSKAAMNPVQLGEWGASAHSVLLSTFMSINCSFIIVVLSQQEISSG